MAYAIIRLLRDVRYLSENLSTLKNVNAPLHMLETVVLEKALPRAAGSPPSPATTPSKTPVVPAAAPTPTKAESANERLRSIFRRHSTHAPEKKSLPDETLLASRVSEKEGLKSVQEKVEEGEDVSPPPPTPEKSGADSLKRVASPPRVSSPPPSAKDDTSTPVGLVEKDLPTPIPANGDTKGELKEGSSEQEVEGDLEPAPPADRPAERKESLANGVNDASPPAFGFASTSDVSLTNGDSGASEDHTETSGGSS